ncbi:MAG: hypothetical protein AB8B47_09130 [Roseobacter sp.]
MGETELLFAVLRGWALVGLIVAVLFLSIGMDRIDEDAQGAYIFRPLLVPGVIVIWPLVLWRWFVYETGREIWAQRYRPPRKSHFAIGLILPIGIGSIVLLGLVARQDWPAQIAPQQIAPPAEVPQ